MTRIESKTQQIARSPSAVYAFLSDLRNMTDLMPPEVTNWQASVDECRFTVKGIGPLSIKITERKPNQQVTFSHQDDSPVAFSLHCFIQPADIQDTCYLTLVLDAGLNPMMKMLAEKPLKNLLDLIVEYFSRMPQSR